jgi:hypothetical protein
MSSGCSDTGAKGCPSAESIGGTSLLAHWPPRGAFCDGLVRGATGRAGTLRCVVEHTTPAEPTEIGELAAVGGNTHLHFVVVW